MRLLAAFALTSLLADFVAIPSALADRRARSRAVRELPNDLLALLPADPLAVVIVRNPLEVEGEIRSMIEVFDPPQAEIMDLGVPLVEQIPALEGRIDYLRPWALAAGARERFGQGEVLPPAMIWLVPVEGGEELKRSGTGSDVFAHVETQGDYAAISDVSRYARMDRQARAEEMPDVTAPLSAVLRVDRIRQYYEPLMELLIQGFFDPRGEDGLTPHQMDLLAEFVYTALSALNRLEATATSTDGHVSVDLTTVAKPKGPLDLGRHPRLKEAAKLARGFREELGAISGASTLNMERAAEMFRPLMELIVELATEEDVPELEDRLRSVFDAKTDIFWRLPWASTFDIARGFTTTTVFEADDPDSIMDVYRDYVALSAGMDYREVDEIEAAGHRIVLYEPLFEHPPSTESEAGMVAAMMQGLFPDLWMSPVQGALITGMSSETEAIGEVERFSKQRRGHKAISARIKTFSDDTVLFMDVDVPRLMRQAVDTVQDLLGTEIPFDPVDSSLLMTTTVRGRGIRHTTTVDLPARRLLQMFADALSDLGMGVD